MVTIDTVETEIVVEDDSADGSAPVAEIDEEKMREVMRRIARRQREDAQRTGAGE